VVDERVHAARAASSWSAILAHETATKRRQKRQHLPGFSHARDLLRLIAARSRDAVAHARGRFSLPSAATIWSAPAKPLYSRSLEVRD
jgi:hypothetical protein